MLKDVSKLDVLKGRNIIMHSCKYSLSELEETQEILVKEFRQIGAQSIGMNIKQNVLEISMNKKKQSSSSNYSSCSPKVVGLLNSSKVKIIYEDLIIIDDLLKTEKIR
jgi:hypothetical protein